MAFMTEEQARKGVSLGYCKSMLYYVSMLAVNEHTGEREFFEAIEGDLEVISKAVERIRRKIHARWKGVHVPKRRR